MKLLIALLAAGLATAAETPKTEPAKDMCAPPPGAVAPALPAHLMTGQGGTHFAITTSNPEAQKFFDQGVNQMHSFWALEAERSFLQAAALDPQAPMPWWGVAMVAAGDYRPRHQLDRDAPGSAKKPSKPSPAAQRAIEAAQKAQQLAQVPGKATDLEKLYIASVAARRDPASPDRDAGYIAGLRAILAKAPDEVEAGSYLALHLMRGFTLPDHQPREGSLEAVDILRRLAARYPDHAGVHHYIIHGWEGASFASEAWPSCRRYPELVPNIPHALHMPGHIYAQTGKWPEAENAFASAAQNELGYIQADALYGKGHHGHNVAFLIVTLDFEGKYGDAMQAASDLMAFGENPREKADLDNWFTPYRQGWFGMLRTLIFAEDWDRILDGKTLPVYDKPREQAWRHYATGLALAHRGMAHSAHAELRQMDASLKELAARTEAPVPPPLEVAHKELEGAILFSQGKKGKALKTLEAAAKQEVSLRYTEPPSYPRSVYAALGNMAASAGKHGIAKAAFENSLRQYPGYPAATRELESRSRAAGE